MKPENIFEILDRNIHNRNDFDCGIDILNNFLKTKANKEMKQNLNTTYVFTTNEEFSLKPIFGFYTLSTSSLILSSVPSHLTRHVPSSYQLPTAKIGRLARDKNYPGIGSLLLKDALFRILRISENMGIYGIEVDAKDEAAKTFYENYGFLTLVDDPYLLFMPIKTVMNGLN